MNNSDLGYISPEQVLAADSSEEYINMLQIYGEDNYDSTFVERMRKAVVMSHYKYGFIRDNPNDQYAILAGLDKVAYEKDENVEHQVNIANYAMFRYMQSDKYGDDREELIKIGIDAMREYKSNIDKYKGTDSGESVQNNKAKTQTVTNWIRQELIERIVREGYPGYFTDESEWNFSAYS